MQVLVCKSCHLALKDQQYAPLNEMVISDRNCQACATVIKDIAAQLEELSRGKRSAGAKALQLIEDLSTDEIGSNFARFRDIMKEVRDQF